MKGKRTRVKRRLNGERVERVINFTSGWLSAIVVLRVLNAHGFLAGGLIAFAFPAALAFLLGLGQTLLRYLRPAGATRVALYDRYGQRENLALDPPLPARERVVRFGFVTEERS